MVIHHGYRWFIQPPYMVYIHGFLDEIPSSSPTAGAAGFGNDITTSFNGSWCADRGQGTAVGQGTWVEGTGVEGMKLISNDLVSFKLDGPCPNKHGWC